MSKLIKRGNKYSVRFFVPTQFQELIGKDEVWRTTGTGDLKEAERRSHRIIADIYSDLEQMARDFEADPRSPKWLKNQATELFAMYERGEIDYEEVGTLMATFTEQHLAARYESPEDLPTTTVRRLRGFSKASRGAGSNLLSVIAERHLKEKQGRGVLASTISRERTVYEAFTEWAGDPEIAAVDRKMVGQWVSEVLVPEDLTVKTKTWRLSALTTLFNWSIRKGLYEKANPFTGMAADIQQSTRGRVTDKRRPWTPDELQRLTELPPDDALYAVTRLCLYAGLRTEEACALKVSDIDLDGGYLKITEGKNANSLRALPLHDRLMPVVKGLVKRAEDEWLIPGLKASGKDGRRSHALSKRAGRWIRTNVSKDRGLVLYTLRHTCLTALEQAGVDPLLIQRIAGHVPSEITFNTYSGGATLEQMRSAIDRLPFNV